MPLFIPATASTPTTVWTPTVTGFSAVPSGGLYYYIQVGKLVTLFITEPNAGTSNATTTTYTLPVTARTLTGMIWNGSAQIEGGGTAASAPGLLYIASGGTTMSAFTNYAGGAWTASGTKRVVFGQITYEAA